MRIVIYIAIIFAAYTTDARAITARTLLAYCSALSSDATKYPSDSEYDAGMCFGFMQATATFMNIIDVDTKTPLFKICLSSGITVSQAVLIFIAYAKGHPQELDYDAPIVIMSSFREHFKCDAKSN